jgi:hypothetical protein
VLRYGGFLTLFCVFRNKKMSLYQGEWSGVPLFTPLKPHGSGLAVFLDGWGYSREDKVLYLTIVRCRYLNVMDISTSDPYCEINCNGISLQTSIKWRNLNPEYHESFEIDVTNPSALLNIVVKDKDYFGADDFMGQVTLLLVLYSAVYAAVLTTALINTDQHRAE